jgi:hypothetical protein
MRSKVGCSYHHFHFYHCIIENTLRRKMRHFEKGGRSLEPREKRGRTRTKDLNAEILSNRDPTSQNLSEPPNLSTTIFPSPTISIHSADKHLLQTIYAILKMKVLTLNFLTCAIKACKSSSASFPLHPKDCELVSDTLEANPSLIYNILPRVDWSALIVTASEVCPLPPKSQFKVPRKLGRESGG